MEKLFSAPVVVAIWGLMNVIALSLLGGFLGAGFGGHMVELYIYIGSAALVFLLAVLARLARRRLRQPLARGLTEPRRPAAMLLLALAFTMLWLGLAFGAWLPMLAIFPLGTAVLMEAFAIRGDRKLSMVQPYLSGVGEADACPGDGTGYASLPRSGPHDQPVPSPICLDGGADPRRDRGLSRPEPQPSAPGDEVSRRVLLEADEAVVHQAGQPGRLEQRSRIGRVADELAVGEGVGHEVARGWHGRERRRTLLGRQHDNRVVQN
jgi:hypothetical protein